MSWSLGHPALLEENARNELDVTSPTADICIARLFQFLHEYHADYCKSCQWESSETSWAVSLWSGRQDLGDSWTPAAFPEAVTAKPGSEKAFSQEATPIFVLKSLSRRKGENTHLKEMEFPPQLCDDSSDKVHPISFDNWVSRWLAMILMQWHLRHLMNFSVSYRLNYTAVCCVKGLITHHALSFPSSQCLTNSCGTFLTGDLWALF